MIDWTERPNWADPVVYEWDFRTSIFRSGGGQETRVSQREKARLVISERVSAWAERARSLRSLMAVSQGDVLGKIDFMDKRHVASPGGLVDTLEFDQNPLWLHSEARIGVFTVTGWVHVDVVSFYDGVIQLASFVQLYPESYIAPVRQTRIKDQVSLSMVTSRVADFNVSFEEVPTSFVLPFEEDRSAGDIKYHNCLLFPFMPNFREPWVETYDRDFVGFDAGYGFVSENPKYDVPNLGIEFTGLGRTRDAGVDMARIFEKCKGRWKPLYLPSHVEDFISKADHAEGSYEVLVGRSEAQQALRFEAHRNIAIRFPGGFFFSEIDEVIEDGPNLRLILHRPLPVAWGPGKPGSWLYQVRFAADKLTLSWVTEVVCEFKVGFTVLPESFYELTINGQRVTLDDMFSTLGPPERGVLYPVSAANDRIMLSGDSLK